MRKVSLVALGREHLERARHASSGRSAESLFSGHEHVMRQTVVAMTAETVLAEHANPGEATVQVLQGRVVLRSGNDVWEAREGDLLVVPPARHDLRAVVDAVIVLTTVVR
jgi:quercetin dioxygenase-like cupin family protein